MLQAKSSNSVVPSEKTYCDVSTVMLSNKPNMQVNITRFFKVDFCEKTDETDIPKGTKSITFINIERYISGLSFAIRSKRKGNK